jgi:hypothetical protein
LEDDIDSDLLACHFENPRAAAGKSRDFNPPATQPRSEKAPQAIFPMNELASSVDLGRPGFIRASRTLSSQPMPPGRLVRVLHAMIEGPALRAAIEGFSKVSLP